MHTESQKYSLNMVYETMNFCVRTYNDRVTRPYTVRTGVYGSMKWHEILSSARTSRITMKKKLIDDIRPEKCQEG